MSEQQKLAAEGRETSVQHLPLRLAAKLWGLTEEEMAEVYKTLAELE